jgi:hypothetical protein
MKVAQRLDRWAGFRLYKGSEEHGGWAFRVTDQPTLAETARLYRAGGWPAEVEGDAFTAPFSAPSAGPPPWQLYRFTFHAAFGVATAEPHGATRWRFERG